MSPLAASVAVLWLLVLALVLLTLLIYKQVGDLLLNKGQSRYEDQGPSVGTEAPFIQAFDFLVGEPVHYEPKEEALVFAFPGCPGCEQIAEILPSVASEHVDTAISLITVFSEHDLEQVDHDVSSVGTTVLPRAVLELNTPEGVRVLLSPSFSEDSPHSLYGVSSSPFVVIVDQDGRVEQKTVLRNREHLGLLLEERKTIVQSAMSERRQEVK